MKSVYILHHTHALNDGEDDVKLIGVYDSYDSAIEATKRLINASGFCDFPNVLEHDSSASDGFLIEKYDIGKDHWQEGFITVVDEADDKSDEKREYDIPSWVSSDMDRK